MGIKRINISYSKVEDRLLLHVSRSGDIETKLWLTYHFTSKMLELLNERLGKHQTIGLDDLTARKVLQVDKALASSKASSNAQLHSHGKALPPAEEATLVTSLKVKSKGDSYVISLGTRNEADEVIDLPRDLLLTIIDAIEKKAAEAGWIFESRYAAVSIGSLSHARH